MKKNENLYLLDYIEENFKLDKEIFDNLRYTLNMKIYYYGDHFSYPNEIKNERYFLKRHFKTYLSDVKCLLKNIISSHIGSDLNSKKILMHSYFNISKLANILSSYKYNVYSPFWVYNPDLFDCNAYKKYLHLRNNLDWGNLNYLVSQNFINDILIFKNILLNKYKDFGFHALIVPYDLSFFENISIQIFKKLQKPSFVFLHGLPAFYSNIDNNRADYLIVWGEKIKEHFVKIGVDKNKIFVSGNLKYVKITKKNLRFSLDNILVLTKSVNGSQFSGEHVLSDRGNSILYLYKVQNVLQKIGLKKVRFRPHPSEDGNWYLKYLDKNFYELDRENLENSLSKASLVIGPASTVLLDALFAGINYVIYEPVINDIDLTNYVLVPPFDGSDQRIPVAKNEDELFSLLKFRVMVDASFFSDYVRPEFDLSFMKKLI